MLGRRGRERPKKLALGGLHAVHPAQDKQTDRLTNKQTEPDILPTTTDSVGVHMNEYEYEYAYELHMEHRTVTQN